MQLVVKAVCRETRKCCVDTRGRPVDGSSELCWGANQLSTELKIASNTCKEEQL